MGLVFLGPKKDIKLSPPDVILSIVRKLESEEDQRKIYGHISWLTREVLKRGGNYES